MTTLAFDPAEPFCDQALDLARSRPIVQDLLKTQCEPYRANPYRDVDWREDSSLSFSDLDSGLGCQDSPEFLMIPHTQGGDYGGSTLDRANYIALADDGGEWIDDETGDLLPGVVTLSGGYGSYGLAVAVDAPTSTLEAVLETVEALQNYPVVSDDALCEYEHSLDEEAWDSWGESDFRSEVESQHGVCIDDVSDDDVLDLFREACERGSHYWETDGPDRFIRMEDVAADVSAKEALALDGASISQDLLDEADVEERESTADYTPDERKRLESTLDLWYAARERRKAEDVFSRTLRYNGHEVPYSDAWTPTHPARSTYTCSKCGQTATINVRPAKGAEEQRRAFGGALDRPCDPDGLGIKWGSLRKADGPTEAHAMQDAWLYPGCPVEFYSADGETYARRRYTTTARWAVVRSDWIQPDSK